jgi:hypothetical protein
VDGKLPNENRWSGNVKCLEWNVYAGKVFSAGATADQV